MSGSIFEQVTIRRPASADGTVAARFREFNVHYEQDTLTEDVLLGLLVRLVAEWHNAAVPYDYKSFKSAMLEVVAVMYEMEAHDLSPAWTLRTHEHHEGDAVCAVATALNVGDAVTTVGAAPPGGHTGAVAPGKWTVQLLEGSGREATLTVTASTLPQLLAGVIHAYTRVYVPEVSQAYTDALPDDDLILDILADGVRDLPGRFFTGEL